MIQEFGRRDLKFKRFRLFRFVSDSEKTAQTSTRYNRSYQKSKFVFSLRAILTCDDRGILRERPVIMDERRIDRSRERTVVINKINVSKRPGSFRTGFPFLAYIFLIFTFLENKAVLFGRIGFYRRIRSVDKKENFRSTFRTIFRDWTRSLILPSSNPL